MRPQATICTHAAAVGERPKSTEQHLWLHRILGGWTWCYQAVPGLPGDDHEHDGATEKWRKQSDISVVGEGNGDHGEMTFTLGYDTDAKHFVGSFITAMMT